VCCSVMHCDAVCWGCSSSKQHHSCRSVCKCFVCVSTCVAVWCSVMQCVEAVAVWNSIIRVEVCASALFMFRRVLQCVALWCSVLQSVAVCCSVMQFIAVWCSVLQCVFQCVSVVREVYLQPEVSHMKTSRYKTRPICMCVSLIHMWDTTLSLAMCVCNL